MRLLLALAALLPTPLTAQAFTPDGTAKVDAVVADALAKTGTPSAPIAISGLGEPTGFTLESGPKLRGGFIMRSYRIAYAGQVLKIVTYAEPGDKGRYEQFLVTPAE